MSVPKFEDQAALVERVALGERPVVFLLGSALTRSTLTRPGVLDCSESVAYLKGAFGDSKLTSRLAELTGPPSAQYQGAFQLLLHHRGQDTANRFIRMAVLNAALAPLGSVPTWRESVASATLETLLALESDTERWALPPAVEILGRLLATYPQKLGGRVLTTNFDPLIEIGIKRAGGACIKTFLDGDGDLGVLEWPHGVCNVVHVHGDWLRSDTLHAEFQLGQPRPRLKESVRELLREASLVVLGYGGWDDALSDAILAAASDPRHPLDILWAFHSKEASAILSSHERLFRGMSTAIGRGRALFYSGVEIRDFFDSLDTQLAKLNSTLMPGAGSPETIGSWRYEGEATDRPKFEVTHPQPEDDSLIIIQPQSQRGHTTVLAASPMFVGRSPKNEVVLLSRSASRVHAKLESRHSRWYISDAGSTFGTFVDDQRVSTPRLLQDGAILRLGDSELIFREGTTRRQPRQHPRGHY